MAWISQQPSGTQLDIRLQKLDASGALTGSEVIVTTSAENSFDLAGLQGGGHVVVWAENGEILSQGYDAGGTAIGSAQQVNTTTANSQSQVNIEALPDGGYVVAWGSDGQDGSSGGIYAQLFDASGQPSGGEFQVNTTTGNSQSYPSISSLSDGGFLVTWNSFFQDGSSDGQRTAKESTLTVGTHTERYQYDPDTGGVIETTSTAPERMAETYQYDKIGNREQASKDGETTTYEANALNQYVKDTHDADGNLIHQGRRTHTWDAENRLIAIHDRGTLIAEYTYDFRSRRIARETSEGVNERYLYEGWNLVAVYHPEESELAERYTWGKDLSGSLQGAGGVGGSDPFGLKISAGLCRSASILAKPICDDQARRERPSQSCPRSIGGAPEAPDITGKGLGS